MTDYRMCRCGAKIDHQDTIGLVNHVLSEEHDAGVLARGLQSVSRSENAEEWAAASRMAREKCRCGHPRSDHRQSYVRAPCYHNRPVGPYDYIRCSCGNFKEDAKRELVEVPA